MPNVYDQAWNAYCARTGEEALLTFGQWMDRHCYGGLQSSQGRATDSEMLTAVSRANKYANRAENGR